jgi:hypothetical protein
MQQIGRASALSALLAPPLSASAAQICDGDVNHDGTVEINEVVTVVNNALNGCGANPQPSPTHLHQLPTPTPIPPPTCGLTFEDITAVNGHEFCIFKGAFSASGCTTDPINSGFAGDGHNIVLAFATTPILALGGVASGPRSMTVQHISWDQFQTSYPMSGTVKLTPTAITATPQNDAGSINGCPFKHYAGQFDHLGIFDQVSIFTDGAADSLGESTTSMSNPWAALAAGAAASLGDQ